MIPTKPRNMSATPRLVVPCEIVQGGIESWKITQTGQHGEAHTILSTDERSRISITHGERMSAFGGVPGECWTTFVPVGWSNQTPRKWFPMQLKFELELRDGLVLPDGFVPRLEISELCPSL